MNSSYTKNPRKKKKMIYKKIKIELKILIEGGNVIAKQAEQ